MEKSVPVAWVAALLAILVIGCGSTPGPGPAPGAMQSPPELRYQVTGVVGQPSYCGPPVVRQDYETVQAEAQFPAIRADAATYAAILAHSHPAGPEASPAYQVAVWREWRMLQAVTLIGSPPTYGFQVHTANELIEGTVSDRGQVHVYSRTPSKLMCPICLAADSLIDTPAGPMPVTALRIGSPVWTATAAGDRLPGVIIRLGSIAFPAGREAIHLVLSDGRSLTVSAGHPLPAGGEIGALRGGDLLDGAEVSGTDRIQLPPGSTYDLLPSGPTGWYWANGIRLASTLQGP